jgi:hypothetical protein
MAEPAYLQARDEGTLLSVKVQPRASRDEIGEALGDALKVRIAAPPFDSAANEALVKFLASMLDCPRGRVELVRGHTSRRKVLLIHGMNPGDVAAKLNRGAS